MGRHRTNDLGLPERVYAHRSGFIYRPAEGKGRILGRTLIDALAEYSRLTGEGVIVAAAAPKPATIGHYVDHLVTKHLPRLSPDTQQQYLVRLLHIKATLGDLAPAALKPKDIYAYIDGVSESAGIRNSILTQFRNLYKAAIRAGACDVNPAREVARDPTPSRHRVPTLAELDAFKAAAGAWWACYVDFKLATGLRQNDLRALPPIPLTAETFTLELSKSKRWKPSQARRAGQEVPYAVDEGVRAILRRLYALKRPQSAAALFCNTRGRPFTRSGFKNAWWRAMTAALAGKTLTQSFHEHDIRATVATLDPANAQARLGHKNRTTTDIYLRKFEGSVVQPLDVESMRNAGKEAKSAEIIHLPEQKKG